MGVAAIPSPAILIVGVLWGRDEVLGRARSLAEEAFGPLQAQSDTIPFDPFTTYYSGEMGMGLSRCLWSFDRMVPRGALAECKLATNSLERRLSEKGNRQVNLDPGILTAESLVLATTKPSSHRVYLGKGIYGDVTLVYHRGGYEPLPWTYPDYRDPRALRFLKGTRGRVARKGRA